MNTYIVKIESLKKLISEIEKDYPNIEYIELSQNEELPSLYDVYLPTGYGGDVDYDDMLLMLSEDEFNFSYKSQEECKNCPLPKCVGTEPENDNLCPF